MGQEELGKMFALVTLPTLLLPSWCHPAADPEASTLSEPRGWHEAVPGSSGPVLPSALSRAIFLIRTKGTINSLRLGLAQPQGLCSA